ncbi:MAG: Gfo/Idh/MocA family oxidoreductase [Verrucomicrobiota bacterium]|nr:Gfo/Idh/MocA family oxidoreductase [Verrucomicrobiota bacterium]
MKLRFGFIGIGAMGLSHVNSIHKLCGDKADITAVCSSNETNIKKVLEIAPKVKLFKNESELIQSPLDAIIVSTPNFTHVRLAQEILSEGKHLFLEKPCGITKEECKKLLEISEQTDRLVMMGHELRYSPYFQKIKTLVENGEIGAPRLVWCREFRGPFQKKTQDWIQDDRRSGGALVDKNCHHFDLINWWVGARPKRVAAFGGCAVNRAMAGPRQVHDHVAMSFEYENGVRGNHQLCLFALDFPNEDLEMGIVGDEGFLQTRISKIEILEWKRGATRRKPIIHKVPAKFGEGWGNHPGFDEIHIEFVNCILEKRQPLTSVRNCVDATLLAIAAEESIKKRSVVEIE